MLLRSRCNRQFLLLLPPCRRRRRHRRDPPAVLVSWRAISRWRSRSERRSTWPGSRSGRWRALRLRHSAKVADGRLQRLISRVAGDRQPDRPGCVVSDNLSLPVAIGVIRPEIVLPVIFADTAARRPPRSRPRPRMGAHQERRPALAGRCCGCSMSSSSHNLFSGGCGA